MILADDLITEIEILLTTNKKGYTAKQNDAYSAAMYDIIKIIRKLQQPITINILLKYLQNLGPNPSCIIQVENNKNEQLDIVVMIKSDKPNRIIIGGDAGISYNLKDLKIIKIYKR